MKEFTSQTGGRYTYIDDIMNLQDLSLAFASIFDNCDNFIISGCQVTGNKISAGFVYINGKIRYCAGTSSASRWPMYVYESNSIEKVSYADSGDKIGRNVYGCSMSSSIPITNDPLTGKMPQAISIASDGTSVRLKDAFFGKYALMIDSPFISQTVKKNVVIEGTVTSNKGITSQSSIDVVGGKAKASISYSATGALTLQSAITGKPTYKMVITEDGAFQFLIGSTLLATLDSSGMTFKVPITTNTVKGGNLIMTNNHIYNVGVAADTGTVNINMLGYNEGGAYYRDMVVGDGKNHAILTIEGKTKESAFKGPLTISSSQSNVFSLTNPTLAKDDKSLLNYVAWKDKNNAIMAYMGYVDNTSFDWYIENKIGNIVFHNNTYIVGSLYVNGIDIISSMVGNDDFTKALKNKANASDVYSKTVADKRYIKVTDSISIFVTQAGDGETGRAAVRSAIGACSDSDVSKAVMKAQLFSDIVTEGLPAVSDVNYVTQLEARKRALCTTIGAAYSADIQNAPKDTGWIAVTVKNCGIVTQIHVRQVGHVVSIQGQLHTHHSGTIFTLPNTVDPPKYDIGYSHGKRGWWHCTMKGGNRDCIVDYCSGGCSEYIGFLMTYII